MRPLPVLLLSLLLVSSVGWGMVRGEEPEDRSPDGVELRDHARVSYVWGRQFDLDLPLGRSVDEQLAYCKLTQHPYRGFELCLAPYMVDLHWVDEAGQPVGLNAPTTEQGKTPS